ncbi:lipid-A-disaccharide synthase N-terminal domain-containing protein [Stenotrophomonas indicatrix]|uniref:lipid-A-disaccharide synthase N-terminal domain-containing protein n=1 Tax=Stenotrophomonas indicatrix TaxID=2045451 RepID=UPI003CCEF320
MGWRPTSAALRARGAWPRATKRAGKPVIPRLFWYMSVVGSLMTLSYFLFSAKQDSVGVLQNLFPAFTALYSLQLDIKHRGWKRDKASH